MANAVFTTQIDPSYDDIPEFRYHFPKRYIRQAEQTLGDWIIYYEPRRESAIQSTSSGRQAYYATARVARIEADAQKRDHFYAYITDYLEFTNPVPFKQGERYFESGLMKEDGTTNRGRFGWNMRVIPLDEYRIICQVGFADSEVIVAPTQDLMLAEPVAEYGRSGRTQIFERPFRDAAFTKLIQKAYGKTCAMTGLKLVNGGGRCEIEAAHIRPVEHEGPDSPRNGIALCRTVHWMFDRGILSLSDSGEILMAKKHIPDQVRRLLNPDNQIILPSQQSLFPHAIFLRYHREHIFKGN